MRLLDAYALVALIGDEPSADHVEKLLRAGSVAMSSVNLAEALDVLGRVHDIAADELEAVVSPLLEDTISVLAPGEPEAWRAADLRRRHYDRRHCALSLADCLLLATAAERGDTVATADPAIAKVARAEGIGLTGLSQRRGGEEP
jgi:predicted nucleic acid-binding protein